MSSRPSFDDRGLDAQIRELRGVDNLTNLLYLGLEYLCIAAVIAAAVVFGERRSSWGLAWPGTSPPSPWRSS